MISPFEKAFTLKYDDFKHCKSGPAKSGKTIFKWKGKSFHHIDIGDNKVAYLIYRGIILTSFPQKIKREDVYSFVEKYWIDIIEPFTEYVDERIEDE